MGWVASFFSWGLAGARAVVVAVGQLMCWVQMCPSLSSLQDANQNIELNKNQKYPKLMYEVSVICSWHLCSDK